MSVRPSSALVIVCGDQVHDQPQRIRRFCGLQHHFFDGPFSYAKASAKNWYTVNGEDFVDCDGLNQANFPEVRYQISPHLLCSPDLGNRDSRRPPCSGEQLASRIEESTTNLATSHIRRIERSCHTFWEKSWMHLSKSQLCLSPLHHTPLFSWRAPWLNQRRF